MSTMRPIGLLLFDAPSASERKARSAQRPLDGIRDLTQALGSHSAQRRPPSTALPDFVSAANVAALRGNGAISTSAAFTVTRAPVEPVRVNSLASAAHAQSQGFASLDDEVTAGTLGLTVGGRSYSLNIAQGSTLKDVVAGVRALGAPVDVSVDSDGARLYLGIRNRNTGFDPSGAAADALVLNQSATGNSGQALGLTVDHQASNAVYTLRGVTSVRSSNRVTDDITGATIDLTNPASTQRRGLDDDLTLSGQRGVGAARSSALVQIDSLARSAQVQSALFDSERDAVKAGTLSLNVEGKSYQVNIKAGDTLADVRRGIENSGAAVTAKIVTDNGGVRMSIISQTTGYPLKGRPADALTVSATSTGSSGQALNPITTQAASNARITVNGAAVSSRSNTINGALPGLTVNAQHVSTSAELIALPGSAASVRPPLNVENEVNRVLQAHLLNPRNFGLAANDNPKITVKDDNRPTDESSWSSPARRLATGGTESSRRDIQQKLTAVDDIFGGLRAAHTLLTAANPSSADAQ